MGKEKIRILHIAQSAGGVDRYIRMLLKYLDKNKFENILVCSQDYNQADYRNLVIEFEQIEMLREISARDILAIKKVRKLIKKYSPDIVYAHSSKAGAITRIANIGLNNYCIYNPHGWAFNMKCSAYKKYIYVLIEKVLSIFCERIICISESEKKSALKKHICKENKIQVIYNGIDIEEYDNKSINKVDLRVSPNAFVVGMVGRISEQKAPDVFIEMAKIIKEKIPNAYFVIVGNGPEELLVREYADKHNLSDSLFISGWVEDPMNYVENFDVACLLSRWEGFGLVLPEYMLVGKPIVATNVDAIPDIIINEYNGLLVEVDNPIEASNAVIRLYNDKMLYDRFVKNGKKEVRQKYNARRVAEQHQDEFIRLIGKN